MLFSLWNIDLLETAEVPKKKITIKSQKCKPFKSFKPPLFDFFRSKRDYHVGDRPANDKRPFLCVHRLGYLVDARGNPHLAYSNVLF